MSRTGRKSEPVQKEDRRSCASFERVQLLHHANERRIGRDGIYGDILPVYTSDSLARVIRFFQRDVSNVTNIASCRRLSADSIRTIIYLPLRDAEQIGIVARKWDK